MRKFFLLAAVACLAIPVAPVSASVFTDAISFDGQIDLIQDNSVSFAFFDKNSDEIVNNGDVIAGILKWNVNIADATPFGFNAITFFVAQIVDDDDTPATVGNIHFELAPVTQAGFDLDTLLATADQPIGGFGSDAIGATFSKVGIASDDLTLGSLGDAMTALNDGSWKFDFSFGFGASDSGDYFETELKDFNTDGVISFDEYDTLTVGTGIGGESGAFTIFDAIWPDQLEVPVMDLFGVDRGTADIHLTTATNIFVPSATQRGHGYIFADNAHILLNPIPEPGSLIVWATIVGLVGICGFRRRRRKS